MPKLLIDVEARFAQFQDSLNKIERQSADAAGKISRAFGGLTTVLAGVGISFGAVALVSGLKQITDSIDALNDASDATGASIENLSALENVARRNGQTLDTVTSAVFKLNQALSEEAGGDKAKILDAIGLSAAELRKEDPAEALKKVADALAGFAEDGNKARIISELFGKSARELAPFLKDVAESGQLNAKVTKEQADEAERFNKMLSALDAELTNLGRSIESVILPKMLELIARMGEARTAGASWAEQLRQAFTGSDSINELKTQIESVDAALEKIRKRREAPGSIFGGGLFGFANDIDESKLINERIALVERLARAQERANPTQTENKISAPDVIPLLGSDKKSKGSNKDWIEEFTSSQQKEALREYEALQKKRTDSEKEWANIVADSSIKLDQLVAHYKDLADPAEKYRKEIELITALEKTGNLTSEEAAAARIRVWNQQAEAVEKVSGKLDKQKSIAEELGLTFSSAAESAIVNFKSLGDVITSVGNDILRFFVRRNITEPLLKSLGNSNLISDSISFFSGKAVFAANGHAFGPSGLIPFANGGVVDSPTPFKFSQGAGIMGEAGPEAILPLKRGAGGKLGVAADGMGGGGVSVTIINNAPAQVSTRQTSDGGLEVLIDAVDAALGDRVSAGIGAISGAMQGRYGLRPSMGI